MPDQPLVSVLVTSYNREKYIGIVLDSILASTYPNFEIIVVDDGSKDNTVAIAKSYADKDSRVRVYINEQNLGDYPNRNKAASYAKGKYLKYVDADDYLYPSGLQTLVDMMEANSEAGWGLCSLVQVKETPYPILLNPREAYLCHFNRASIFDKAPLSAIIKRSVFEEVNGFKAVRMVGDNDMWHRLGQKYPVLLMPDGVVWYREHGDQEIGSILNYIKDYAAIKSTYLLHPDSPLSKEEGINILNTHRRRHLVNAVKSLIRMNTVSFQIHWRYYKYLKTAS